MLLNYNKPNPTGRPRNKIQISKEEQAVVYDFLFNNITATQASKTLNMPIASFRQFVSYVVEHWIETGFINLSSEVTSLDEFKEK